MTILSVRGIRHRFRDRSLFEGVDLSLDAGERLGIVGANGTGKSTLMRILSGQLEPDEGERVQRRDLRISVMEQSPPPTPGRTVLELALDGLAQWRSKIDEHESICAELERASSDAESARLLDAQSELIREIEELGGWDREHEARSILGPLGLSALADRPLTELSGGERRRAHLARLLVARPELALLDEPTNHLDLATVEWLDEELSQRFQGALVLVTHDRALLDAVATRTIELDGGRLHSSVGGWTAYLEARAAREAHAERVEANRRNFLRRELEWLRRQPKARTGKQKARVERAQAALDQRPTQAKRDAQLELTNSRMGRQILGARELEIASPADPSLPLCQPVNLELRQGERLAVVGPNGCGKTTLLETLIGRRDPLRGEVQRGANTRVRFLDQQRQGLDPKARIDEAVGEGRGVIEVGDQTLSVRAYLERFLFPVPTQGRRIEELSGGERARVALAKTLSDPTNLIVLDEPTNDLDLSTLLAMEQCLQDFGGCALIVSHDRRFLDRVASAMLVFEESRRLVWHAGSYSDYRERCGRSPIRTRAELDGQEHAPGLETPAEAVPDEAPVSESMSLKPLTYAERLELEKLETQMAEADEILEACRSAVEDPELYTLPPSQQQKRFSELKEAEEEVDRLFARWAELEERSGAN